MRVVLRIYALWLRLYPRRFRSEFGPEMQSVFAALAADAHRRGGLALPLLLARELAALPGCLLREHWNAGQPRRTSMAMNPGVMPLGPAGRPAPGTWRAALLAGLPHALFALVLYAPPVIFGLRDYGITTLTAPIRNLAGRSCAPGPSYLYGPARDAFWVIVGLVVLVGVWRGLPRWWASWAGYGLYGLLDAIFKHTGAGIALPLVLMLAWVVLLLTTQFWLARRDPLSGLLLMLPIFPMGGWLMTMEVVICNLEGLVYLPAGLLTAVAAAWAVRRGSLRWGLGAALAVLVIAGLPISYAAAFYPSPTFPASASVGDVISGTAGGLVALGLSLLPLWALLVGRRLRQPPPSAA